MAHFEQLPVYKACYDLLLAVYNDLNKLPRDIRFTLLETVKNNLVTVAELIFRANSTRDKKEYISEARNTMIGVKVRIRLLYDLHHINIKTYTRLAEQAESISKQLSSWYDYQNKSARGESPAKQA